MDARALIVCAAMAVAAGLVACFAVMRRMTLAADAFSHVALPGIGLALVLRLNPLIGALVALLAGSMLIWAIEGRTKLSTEAITGVVFSVALAIGSLTATGEELIDALFGTPGSMTIAETIFALVAALAVIAFILKARDRLLVSLVSTEVAIASGIGVTSLQLSFLVAFAVTVALGMRYLGVLLMGSLIIIPVTVRESRYPSAQKCGGERSSDRNREHAVDASGETLRNRRRDDDEGAHEQHPEITH